MTDAPLTTPGELLDRGAAAREVAMLVALVLIRVHGDPDDALAMLADFDGIAPVESDQLDAVTIAAQAVRDALGMGVQPQ